MPTFSSTTVFWLSQPGTVSNLHYDRSHNYYVALGGALLSSVPHTTCP